MAGKIAPIVFFLHSNSQLHFLLSACRRKVRLLSLMKVRESDSFRFFCIMNRRLKDLFGARCFPVHRKKVFNSLFINFIPVLSDHVVGSTDGWDWERRMSAQELITINLKGEKKRCSSQAGLLITRTLCVRFINLCRYVPTSYNVGID